MPLHTPLVKSFSLKVSAVKIIDTVMGDKLQEVKLKLSHANVRNNAGAKRVFFSELNFQL